jgi:hypothetical protein
MNAFDDEKVSCLMSPYYICALSQHNLRVAEDMMTRVGALLEVVGGQGLDTSDVEDILTDAKAFLESAETFSQNCIASNTLAVQCQNLLKKCLEMLESKEEYSVYTALIKAKYTEGLHFTGTGYDSGPVQIYVITDHTAFRVGNGSVDWLITSIPALEQETLNDFHVKNEEEYPLVDSFYLSEAIVLIREEAVTLHFEDKGWNEFYQIYPFSQGIMTLSRVGFNSEMNQALVYVGNQAEYLGGAGYYVLLVKEAGVWVIHAEIMAWIS